MTRSIKITFYISYKNRLIIIKTISMQFDLSSLYKISDMVKKIERKWDRRENR